MLLFTQRGVRGGDAHARARRPPARRWRATTVEIYLDPEEARTYGERRARRLNVLTIPLLRFVALNVVALGVLLHDLALGAPLDAGTWFAYAVAIEAYALLSWLVLQRFYGPGREALALGFLVLDFVPLTAAIYLTGATQSWLFFILLFRVVDQAATSFRRVLLFAHLTPLSYLALVAWSAEVDGAAIAWGVELTKTLLLYLGALYALSAARASEAMRQRTSAAVRVARDLIVRLRDQQAALQRRSMELQEARAVAESASEARAALLARASHELRTPLNQVIGFAQLLEDAELTGEQRSNVAAILQGGGELLHLVDDMLQITDLQRGRPELTLQPVALREILAMVLAAARTEAAAQRVRLADPPGPECDRVVLADPERLRDVLEELVANAIAYNSVDGHVVVSCVEASPGRIRIRITDTGIGVPAERLEDVFAPFERLGVERVSSLKGAGLGLAVARAAVSAMGGELGVEERQEVGSTFWVELPVAHQAANA
ncbi:MAG TPA: HAMP domain-containing sensor histidine kinase [Longimicrobiales bacterium]|nr:HAMP domain-containing sensor histidine kinase [Longimicrobiales bacterium]